MHLIYAIRHKFHLDISIFYYPAVLKWRKKSSVAIDCVMGQTGGWQRWRIDAWFTTGRMSRVIRERKLTTQRVIGWSLLIVEGNWLCLFDVGVEHFL